MKQLIAARLMQLDPRVLQVGMAAMLLFIVLQGWLLVFRQPLVQYARMKVDPALVAQAERDAQALPLESQRLAEELATLRERVHATRQAASQEQMVVELIGELDRLAQRHGVSLHGVRPAPSRKVPVFEEAAFQVDARGGYVALMAWLSAVERRSNLAIGQFEISPAGDTERTISVKLAAYRWLDDREDKE